MARQSVWVPLEQSDMCIALNKAKMAKGVCLHAATKEMEYLIKIPSTKVWEKMMQGVEFPGHTNVKAAMVWHPGILWEHHMDGYVPCQNGTALNPQTLWRHKGICAPLPDWHRQRQVTQEPMPLLAVMPSVPASYNVQAHVSEIEAVPPGYVYIHTPLPCVQFFNFDTYTKDQKHDKNWNPDLLTNEGPSTN